MHSLQCRRVIPFGKLSLSLHAPRNALRFVHKPAFTFESYKSLHRDPKYAKLSEQDVQVFKSIIGKDGSLIDGLDKSTDPADLDAFNIDWMNKYRGKTQLALKPKTTQQVSEILKYCNQKKLAVVPQGGNTGLVGGSVPVFDEIVLNLGLMNQIHTFDEISGVITLDSGVILENADNFLAEKGYMFPLDLGAKGSCQVGGCAATAAGGLRLLRYGSLHGSILGMEAVLPDGTILDNLVTLRKDNTGLDIKQLFIGSEGYLGVITKLSVICPKRPSSTNVAFFGVPSYENVLKAFSETRSHLTEILSAFELMDNTSQTLVDKYSGTQRPLEDEHPFYVLVETQGSNKEHDEQKITALVEDLLEKEIISDGVLAQDESQLRVLWERREGITECLAKAGSGVYKYDVSLPLPVLYDLVNDTKKRLIEFNLLDDTPEHPVIDVVGFGHMGDGNLHLNIAVRQFDKRVEKCLEPWVYEWVSRHRGSISAEHGLGLLKKPFVGYSKSKEMIHLMKTLKNVFDPNGIMLPYKYV
ncbi:D-lactate dehydrogenase [Schizosaccharomyces pombe]|uniref:Putative D-lactate dehydrogenase C713.03, mitochondrial n=1 Tax=Schizosaccharomyces pombe (strain 972 / ATCC 24843) TaxID=284812 RepID=YN53_SCHPO|nr:putative D-lactate dehydrogenase [Schizosaccharomyces pombe]Q9C1X2.1 RecName: Full=Putative D-lactate dehydrogenase C713.03, mitochondrial; Flags: Precursor [Schizosaccharomyces pombe 972h-]CAC22604.1 mitochondrial D-lactate dehydrogenase, cytochrome (predicted) [Schizosaccharomyces pombe]|eukprot:NP_595342.1 putative D-lactate dehydrogenase [Schizosaccharomyces pombe]